MMVNKRSMKVNLTFPPDYVASTVNNDTLNTFVTPVLTNHLNHTEEQSLLQDSIRSSHHMNETYGSTVVDDDTI